MAGSREEVRDPPRATEAAPVVAVVVPHTHWDREWYAPFETMRFHLVRFFDELLDTLEQDPSLPAFVLDGQAVIVEDYLEVRPSQRERVCALVSAGRLRPGPFYVQPDEFHVSGEALVRNLLAGIAVSGELGWVMREGYLPDTFGHVHQLPQLLLGFGIETFYAMRGFGVDVDQTGSQFWWEAPDGSRVLAEWLTESYSNAAVLTDDPATMSLQHGVLVRYDCLPELLDRLSGRSPTGVLLLLNGGDHLRVQAGVTGLVRSLDTGVGIDVRLGGLEEFHRLVAQRRPPELVLRGELRHGARHDVFDGIGSTRTPLKLLGERTEAHLSGIAERLDALATLIDGRSSADPLRHAWRELVKNHAHDSICGCSVDAVHDEMALRFTKVAQVAQAVASDALARIGTATAPAVPAQVVPIVVVNPSSFPRTGPVSADVLFDLDAPVGRREFGYIQRQGADPAGYRLVDPTGHTVPFTAVAADEVVVGDTLNRRKELRPHRVSFVAADVPPLGTVVYRLLPEVEGALDAAGLPAAFIERAPATVEGLETLATLGNETMRVDVAPDGTLSMTVVATGRRLDRLLELLDDADAGDEYGFGPVPGDRTLSSRTARWTVHPGPDPHTLLVQGTMTVPRSLTADRATRSIATAQLPVKLSVRLPPGIDRLEVDVTIDNQARDHRLQVRFPTGTDARSSLAESAFGVIRRPHGLPESGGWQEHPSGAFTMRRFVALEGGSMGLQIITEGLHEYYCPADGLLDVTLLRAVGWLARKDHPLRPHKVGPQLRTPRAQCLGRHTFRFAIRPYESRGSTGDLYRAVEEFAVPLQGWAVPDQRPLQSNDAAPPTLGLAAGPEDVVLSAVKPAENGDGMIVRVFNSAPTTMIATLLPRFALTGAARCTLEETADQPLPVGPDGVIKLALDPGQIATVRLHPHLPAGEGRNR